MPAIARDRAGLQVQGWISPRRLPGPAGIPLAPALLTRRMRLPTAIALAAVLGVFGVTAAPAADQPLPARRLLVLDLPGHGVLFHNAKHEDLGVQVPAPGGPDDPTTVGGTLLIYNPTTCESATFDMPASHWRIAHAEGALAFKFVNRDAPAPPSEVLIAVIGVDRVKVRARASGITLDEPSQGSLGVVVTLGAQRYCTFFGGFVTRDGPGGFTGRLAPAPASCPTTPCVPSATQ
jgi:hypothetical protein